VAVRMSPSRTGSRPDLVGCSHRAHNTARRPASRRAPGPSQAAHRKPNSGPPKLRYSAMLPSPP
jgi:hypothetical protein